MAPPRPILQLPVPYTNVSQVCTSDSSLPWKSKPHSLTHKSLGSSTLISNQHTQRRMTNIWLSASLKLLLLQSFQEMTPVVQNQNTELPFPRCQPLTMNGGPLQILIINRIKFHFSRFTSHIPSTQQPYVGCQYIRQSDSEHFHHHRKFWWAEGKLPLVLLSCLKSISLIKFEG